MLAPYHRIVFNCSETSISSCHCFTLWRSGHLLALTPPSLATTSSKIQTEGLVSFIPNHGYASFQQHKTPPRTTNRLVLRILISVLGRGNAQRPEELISSEATRFSTLFSYKSVAVISNISFCPYYSSFLSGYRSFTTTTVDSMPRARWNLLIPECLG
jgi:hypothetical protein